MVLDDEVIHTKTLTAGIQHQIRTLILIKEAHHQQAEFIRRHAFMCLNIDDIGNVVATFCWNRRVDDESRRIIVMFFGSHQRDVHGKNPPLVQRERWYFNAMCLIDFQRKVRMFQFPPWGNVIKFEERIIRIAQPQSTHLHREGSGVKVSLRHFIFNLFAEE